MNIAEILKDCPKGTKLYSLVYGDVFYQGTHFNKDYPIAVAVECTNDTLRYFTSDGRLNINFNGECTLFPSKENRDWSIFKTSKKEYIFKPFDKVLVRDLENDDWRCDFFSNYTDDINYYYRTVGGCYKQCIPYEGNEHLLGTSNPA